MASDLTNKMERVIDALQRLVGQIEVWEKNPTLQETYSLRKWIMDELDEAREALEEAK